METLKTSTDRLLAYRERTRQMGGEEAVQKQHESGKLTARERIELLFDPGSFVEYGILATHQSAMPDMQGKVTPADGVITGVGRVDGRPCCVAAYDFTVMAGSMGEVGERKVKRMRELSMRERIPMVWLLDSSGARIQEAAGAQFAGSGSLFLDQVMMSGVVPQVGAVMGPTAAGTAYIPALTDFVPMVANTSSMALAGPPLVKAAINEDVTVEDLGGSKVHCRVSGCADLEVADDRECISAIKRYLSFFPSHSGEAPPRSLGYPEWPDAPGARKSKFAGKAREAEGSAADTLAMSDAVLEALPEDPRKGYDMRKVIREIVDQDPGARGPVPVFMEIKPEFARNLITGLSRINGWSVGIVANQPEFMGGAIDVDAADKAARFINLCDAFNIPLLFLHDTPGFMVGSRMEKLGIIRHGAKMLFAVSEASVPKFSVIVRRSYGAGYYVMCGRGYDPDLLVAWPTSEVSLMSPEGAVNIIFRKEISAAPDPEAARAARVDQYRSLIGGQLSASQGHLDDVIDPRETRRVLAHALASTRNKRVTTPEKKRSVTPV
ncbi:MAG: acyl-CoA carboxylase subunit beta [Bdellovibrionales bacterium]|nr:acyl-CoA carboxylase subunit beta [Bdellovibrionales bacterium]